MLDLSLNLFTLIIGVLIFGLGYTGLFIKYILEKKDFYAMKLFDKIIQSIIIGTLSFLVTSNLFTKIDYTDESIVLNFIISHPIIFIYQTFFVLNFIYAIIIIKDYLWMLNDKIKNIKI